MTVKEFLKSIFTPPASPVFTYVSADATAPKHSQSPELIIPRGNSSTWVYLDFAQKLLKWCPHNKYEADVWDANYTEWRARLFQHLADKEELCQWLRLAPINLGVIPERFWNHRHELLSRNLAGDIWRIEAWLMKRI